MKRVLVVLLAFLVFVFSSCQLSPIGASVVGGEVDLSAGNGSTGQSVIKLDNFSFSEYGAGILNGIRNDSKKLAKEFNITLPSWLEVSLPADVKPGDTAIVIVFKVVGTPDSTSDGINIEITIGAILIEDKNGNVPDSGQTVSIKGITSEPTEDTTPTIDGDVTCNDNLTIKATEGENFTRDLNFTLVNLKFSSQGAQKFSSDISNIQVPSGVTLKLLNSVKAEDRSFALQISGSAQKSGSLSINLDGSYFEGTSKMVKKFSGRKFNIQLDITAKPSEPSTPSTQDPVVPSGVLNKVSSNYVNSVQIGTNTPIGAKAGQNLYTIVINYPDEYTGEGSVSYQLSGFGNKGKAASKKTLLEKTVPSGISNWNDMWSFNGSMSGSGSKTTGRYWYTDEKNKLKFYINDAYYSSILINNRTIQLGSDFWDDLKNALQKGVFKDDILSQERQSFGDLKEYNKDQTPYFYVIFDDFGEGSVSVSQYSIGGTVGVYNQNHIRSYTNSNQADIFYVNTRYVAGMSKVNTKSMDDTALEISKTFIHEYMHFLMDSNQLLCYENDPFQFSTQEEYGRKLLTSSLDGSLFWIEGTANYAPYRMIKKVSDTATWSWLTHSDEWRPAIDKNDRSSAQAGDTYAVYGAGGVFFSYVAEMYGYDTENKFHTHHDYYKDVENAEVHYQGGYVDYLHEFGNINIMTKKILNSEFKDVYLNFLLQCMSGLSDDVAIKGCVQKDFKSTQDWGFSIAGFKQSSMYQGYSVYDTITNSASGTLNQLSFRIQKWNQIPEKISVSGGNNIRCYAVWF